MYACRFYNIIMVVNTDILSIQSFPNDMSNYYTVGLVLNLRLSGLEGNGVFHPPPYLKKTFIGLLCLWDGKVN